MMRKKNTSSRLRHRVTLQQEIRTPDGVGGFARSWDDVADLWAEITVLTGRERWQAMQLQSEITHRIITRYRGGISAGDRLLTADGRAFNLRYVANVDEGNELLEMLADEGVA